ncbi:TlpA disulfide reductase family protein [Chitinophaga pollutisoli]|uniref:TlpA disulfide reductase family protein n=1 Tax=Chitinophaga pollutisoli TaxID=3133966 RepID=A0ABZ2YKX6_9BACT
MKPYLILLALLLATFPSTAQFTLSGTIRNYSGGHPLTVNLPVVFGFHKENTQTIPMGHLGTFRITLPADSLQTATLFFRKKQITILMQPGGSLAIELDENARTVRFTGGSLAKENQWIQETKLDEAPFFWENDSLAALPEAKIRQSVLAPYAAERNRHIQAILASGVPHPTQQYLISELRYLHINYLHDFFSTSIPDRATARNLEMSLFDEVPIQPAFSHPGPQYFAFADNYIRYLETKAFVQIQKENRPPSAPIPYFGISLDSANVIVSKYGKAYWRWIGSLRNFPPEIAVAYNWQQIRNLYHDGDIAQAEGLSSAFLQRFPDSRFSASVARMRNQLRNKLAANAGNPRIVVLEDSADTQSVQAVVQRLKGKVVFLDVWGTWCGPCKEEIKHLPALRAAFPGEEVAFVFLAMDDDNRHAIWKDFIRANAMEGTHFRKTRQTIPPLWNELLENHPDKSQSYPQYFLFDKSGKLAVAKAHHPSEGEVLYRQIRDVLSKVE